MRRQGGLGKSGATMMKAVKEVSGSV